MVIGAARNQLYAACGELQGHSLRVFHDLAGILLEFRLESLTKAHRLGCDHMLQRAALCAGENGRVDALDQVFVVGQDQAAARAAQGFVGGGGDHIGVGHGVLVHTTRHQTSNVRHIHHQHSAVAVGNGCQLFKVDGTGIGRSTGHQQLGAHLCHLLGQGIIVNAAIGIADAIGNEMIVFAAHVGGAAVGEMAALRKIHAHHGISQLQQGKIHSQIGLCTAVRLHIGIFCTKQLTGTVDGQLLHFVHKLAAAVIAVAGITLGIFIGKHAAHGGHYGGAYDVFTGDQFDIAALAVQLTAHTGSNLRVRLCNQTDGVHHFFIHSAKPSLSCGHTEALCLVFFGITLEFPLYALL